MSDAPSPVTVTAGDAVDVDHALHLLAEVYGRPFSRSWWHWKHVECPWGASRPFAVVDDHGETTSVFFVLPWLLDLGVGPRAAARLVDGATRPHQTRRGSFTSMVATALRTIDSDVTFCTATPDALRSHVRNGAVAVAPLPYVLRPVRWASAALESGVDLLDTFEPGGRGAGTAWDAESLRWRVDPRSGGSYRVSRLRDGSTAHGVVYRTNRSGPVATISLLAEWGPDAECRRAVRAAARQERAALVHAPVGPGTTIGATRGLGRGVSLLCVWDGRTGGAAPSIGDRAAWALDGLTLEGVI